MRFVLIIVWCWWASRLGWAQISAAAGMIQGAVSDVSGSGVASAIVVAQNVGTGTRRTTQTDSSGNFALPSIAIGTWKLSASAPGFSTSETGPFQVSVGQVVVRRIQLQLAGIVEKLDVTESPDAIEAQSSSASVTLGSERIEEAPARSRNYLNFVLAASGGGSVRRISIAANNDWCSVSGSGYRIHLRGHAPAKQQHSDRWYGQPR